MSHLGYRLSALIDGELSHAQRERVLAHLANCEPCRYEAAALRVLKQRMHALGEATANTALTDRLVALGARGQGPGSGLSRRRWRTRSLAVAFLAMAGLSVPAAAFMAGGGQAEPGPGVTPAIEEFMTQHEITTGDVPTSSAQPSPSPSSTPRHHGGRHHPAALQPAGAG